MCVPHLELQHHLLAREVLLVAYMQIRIYMNEQPNKEVYIYDCMYMCMCFHLELQHHLLAREVLLVALLKVEGPVVEALGPVFLVDLFGGEKGTGSGG